MEKMDISLGIFDNLEVQVGSAVDYLKTSL